MIPFDFLYIEPDFNLFLYYFNLLFLYENVKYTIKPTITQTTKIIHVVNVTLYSNAPNKIIEIIGKIGIPGTLNPRFKSGNFL